MNNVRKFENIAIRRIVLSTFRTTGPCSIETHSRIRYFYVYIISTRCYHCYFFQQGSVFFPLPDGNGLLYNVTGVSEAPKAISNIVRDVPCKTNYTELLSVNNWLKKPQRYQFSVSNLELYITPIGNEFVDFSPGCSAVQI